MNLISGITFQQCTSVHKYLLPVKRLRLVRLLSNNSYFISILNFHIVVIIIFILTG